MQSQLQYTGVLVGHDGAITDLATCGQEPNKVLSGSRDKSLLVWRVEPDDNFQMGGVPLKRYTGHSEAVTGVDVNEDFTTMVSSSWDHTCRIWDVETGVTSTVFKGHSSDVLSISYTPSYKHILSTSRDRTIKLWGLSGEVINTFDGQEHKDWVTCAKVSVSDSPIMISGSRDCTLKIWNFSTLTASHTLNSHRKAVTAVDVAPDGSLCASASADEKVVVWDIQRASSIFTFEAEAPVNALRFNPARYWLAIATDTKVHIIDLESQETHYELMPLNERSSHMPWATAVQWSADGNTLFVGCSDNNTYVYQITN